MTISQFNYPTTMLYGAGALGEFSRRLAAGPGTSGHPVLLVSDAGLVRAGVVDTVAAALTGAGLAVEVFDGVQGNPTEGDVDRGAEAFRDSSAGAIVGLGGGSPMDVAKVIAIRATHEGPLSRFDDSKGGDRHVVHPLPPIYAIPTTAGTGSEVGRSGVIICADTGVKTVIFHPDLMPRIAVLDPELSVGLPPALTAATGMDAFTHGLEAYLAGGFHPMADAIALGCMELVIRHLPRAVERGDDLEARGRMLIAASMGATAFQKGLGMIHSMAHPLSTRYGMHHGLANALLMPPVLRWQYRAKSTVFGADLKARHRRVAGLFGAGGGELPALIADLNARAGIDQSLAALGLCADDTGALADEAFADGCHQGNPFPVSRDDFAAVYTACL